MKASKLPRSLPAAVTLAGALSVASCAAPAPTGTRAGAGGAVPPEPIASADRWSVLSWEERHDRMTWLVHPNMAKLFQSFAGTPYPAMTCRTCHGADAEQVQYKMPHGLPALDPAHLPDPRAGGPKARIAKFMIEEVTPQMADLLGAPRRDPKTGRGFDCFGCHPAQGAGVDR
jgi:hypothetical protein